MSDNDEYTIPLNLWPDANHLNADPVEYHNSWYRYELLSNIQLRGSDTVVVSGYGVHLKVRTSPSWQSTSSDMFLVGRSC